MDISFSWIVPADRDRDISSVLSAMGDSLESWPASPMVRHSRGILAAAGAHHPWTVNLYLIVLMGSNAFTHSFLNSGLLARRFGPRAKLDAFLRNNRPLHPAQFIGAATRGGRVLHNALSRLASRRPSVFCSAPFAAPCSTLLLKRAAAGSRSRPCYAVSGAFQALVSTTYLFTAVSSG